MFKDFVKQKRIDLNLSLRAFCKEASEDPSNWSKIERGILAPPKDLERLKKIANTLKIEVESDEWNILYNSAFIDSGEIPENVMSNQDVLEILPAFFRTIESKKPSREDLENLMSKLWSEK